MKIQYLILLVCLISSSFADNNDDFRPCPAGTPDAPCPKCRFRTQNQLDECYMRVALDFALVQNPNRPYGALIVDQYRNVISCYGVNRGAENVLFHGETSAMFNCTALYPSPIGNDVSQPGLFYPNQTLYTTAEPCPMCSTQTMWRGIGRVVYGTDIPTLVRLGSKQITIRTKDIYKQGYLDIFKNGGQPVSPSVPYLKGGVLKEDCDRAFFHGFGFQYPPSSPFYGTEEDVFLTKN